ncbi:MAG: SDR family NAD(P)-dependent oxidoreductase [Patescibacteria group bacterium]
MRKIALVIGASSNVGQKTCEKLINAGYTVYAGFNTTIIPKSKFIIPLKIDVTNDLSCEQSVANILRSSKRLDAVIYLVGVSPKGLATDFTPKDLMKVYDINTIGFFRIATLTLPHLAKTRGYLISVASICGIISFPNFSIYSASKFALRAISLAIHHEQYSSGVHTICIFPGAIASNSSLPKDSARVKIPLLKFLLPLLDSNSLGENIIKILNDPNPPPEKLLGSDALLLTFMQRFIPAKVWHYLQKRVWQTQS